MEEEMKLVTEEADPKKVAEDMAKSILKMREDRDHKARNAKKSLISQLEVTADKYLTANGVMAALTTVREVASNNAGWSDEIAMAKTVATNMSRITMSMRSKAKDLVPDDMDQLCDDFYDKNFSQNDGSVIDMVHELMILQLCQNVGPNAEDIVDFLAHTDEEISKSKQQLREYCEENGLDYSEVIGE